MNNTFNKKFASNELRSIKLLLILATIIYAITTLLFIGYNYSVQIPYAPQSLDLQGNQVKDYTPATVLMLIYYATMVLIPIYQFRYLYNKKAIDFFHSLPIKRTTLMSTKTIVGYSTMSLSFAIFFTITNVAINHDFLESINILLLTLLSGALIYAFMLFMINITNNLFFLATTTISLIVIPFFIISGVCSLISTFTIFNVHESTISNKFTNLFNIFTLSTATESYYSSENYSMYSNNSVIQILAALIVTTLLLVTSTKLYNSRKSYEDSHFIIFKPIRIVYISLLTFTISLMLSTLFFEQSTLMIYLTTIFCIFAVSVLLDIITNFTNGNQKQEIKYSVIPAVALLLLLNFSTNNFYGVFDTIPINEVQSISISKDSGKSFLMNFTDSETFDTIQTAENDLIQQYYANHTNYNDRFMYSDNYVFIYTMNNGETKSRKYFFNILDNIDNANAIVTIPEYKQNVINTLKDEKTSVDIRVAPTVTTDADDNLTSYYRLIDYTDSYQIQEGTSIQSMPSGSGNSNDALLDALILDITNDKDFQTIGYAHPNLGTISIDINTMTPVPINYTTSDTVYDPSKGIVTSNEKRYAYVSDFEALYIPLKPYYTNTLQAINYNPDYSVLLIEDFSEDVATPFKETQYISNMPQVNDTLHASYMLPFLIQYYYDANNDTSYESSLYAPCTVDELLDRLRKYDLLTNYTVLSTDEELQQFNDSYTIQTNSMNLITNSNTTNYRAFIIDNKTGKLSVGIEQIVTTQPDLY